MKKLLFATMAAAALALCACGSIVSKTPTATFEFSGEAYGPAAATNPAGLTQASLAALAVRGVVVPDIYTDAAGNQVPFTVDGPCHTREVPSLRGVSSVNASAQIDANGKPSVGGGNNEGMMWGASAWLESIAEVQKAYDSGSGHDALKDYLSCGGTQPVAASDQTAAQPAAKPPAPLAASPAQ